MYSYTMTLTDEQEAVMQRKYAVMSTAHKAEHPNEPVPWASYAELLTFKLQEYIAACRRDLQAGINLALAQKMAGLSETEKTNLLATLSAPK